MDGVLASAVAMLAGLHGLGAFAASVQAPATVSIPPRCLRALVPVAAGTVPHPGDFAAIDCPKAEREASFRYDVAQHSSRVVRAIAGNEIVSAFPEFGGTKIMPGEPLRLVARYGAVRVERQVQAMQAARPGQRLFVKASDGQVISVRYEVDAR